VSDFSFSSLSLRDRPKLFEEISTYGKDMREPFARGKYGGKPGWLVVDGPIARALLKSPKVGKSRPETGQKYLGGVGALQGPPAEQAKRQLIKALNAAARNGKATTTHLRAAIGDVRSIPDSGHLTEAFSASMLTQLSGTAPGSVGRPLIRDLVTKTWEVLELLQDAPEIDQTPDDDCLEQFLQTLLSDSGSDFLDILRETGWTNGRIALELRAMVLSSWGSTTAATLSALSLDFEANNDRFFLNEAMRLYPSSFLIGRTILDRDGRFPFEVGDLVVVSPWLIHRSNAGWTHPDSFDLNRWKGGSVGDWFIPFGAGPRRCPAPAFAKAQISAALNLFEGLSTPEGATLLMVEQRIPSLVPKACPVGSHDYH
jgi:Cytochrome P450